MPMDEVDSGVDEVSVPESREGSPAAKKDKESMALAVNNADPVEEDDDIDETVMERLWGLTEMFPQCVRNGTWTVTTGALSTAKVLYSFSRSALWIFFSSSAILFAPVIFEMERMQLQEDQRQQQRQV
ncbi:mitochondrial import receptor subunit TOM22 homolog [Centruroides sculpturatus]|uniref:mitochondrial import receptor subunit TOM22 homolog n=1 Tax=Centruroides sculpturatus TaxID=218467 RepID=UPI000C6E733D|nr:mitochondrial import receptor subunit TOM22 homolog [Centruroides sculpturatus]